MVMASTALITFSENNLSMAYSVMLLSERAPLNLAMAAGTRTTGQQAQLKQVAR